MFTFGWFRGAIGFLSIVMSIIVEFLRSVKKILELSTQPNKPDAANPAGGVAVAVGASRAPGH
jgi:hypothetical protein